MTGTVETLQTYGAFIRLENGLSGLVHVSQICEKRIKTPADVLKTGEEVNVKVIGIKDGKISLSIKVLIEPEEEVVEEVEIPKSEEIGTSLGDLFKKYSTIVKKYCHSCELSLQLWQFYTVASLHNIDSESLPDVTHLSLLPAPIHSMSASESFFPKFLQSAL